MIANILSISRFFLAFAFFIHDPWIRVGAIFLAMLSDVLDGFLARCLHQVSKIGTLLDPASDKFFVGTALLVFIAEDKLSILETTAFLAREISLVGFTLYLLLKGAWSSYTIRSFITGKVMTSLQFLTLMGLSLDLEVPAVLFYAMGFFGVMAFPELLVRNRSRLLFGDR